MAFTYYTVCHTCRACLSGSRVACPHLTMAMLKRADKPPYFVGGTATISFYPLGRRCTPSPDAVSDEVASGANCALSQVMQGLETASKRSEITSVKGLEECRVVRFGVLQPPVERLAGPLGVGDQGTSYRDEVEFITFGTVEKFFDTRNG